MTGFWDREEEAQRGKEGGGEDGARFRARTEGPCSVEACAGSDGERCSTRGASQHPLPPPPSPPSSLSPEVRAAELMLSKGEMKEGGERGKEGAMRVGRGLVESTLLLLGVEHSLSLPEGGFKGEGGGLLGTEEEEMTFRVLEGLGNVVAEEGGKEKRQQMWDVGYRARPDSLTVILIVRHNCSEVTSCCLGPLSAG